MVTGTYNPLDIEFVSITVVPSRTYVSFSHVMYPWNVTSIVLLYILLLLFQINIHSFMWGELTRMNPKGKYVSNVVDGISNESEIANMFADKYRSLYRSVPTSDLEMDSLTGMINARMASIHESNNLDCVIGTEQVFNAIRQLKSNKRDGQQDFFSIIISLMLQV